VVDVRLDRRSAHHQSLGDLSVRQALGDQPQHLDLAGGQTVRQLRGGRLGERRQDVMLDCRVERRVAARGQPPDRLDAVDARHPQVHQHDDVYLKLTEEAA
jgi:hypothetical protein